MLERFTQAARAVVEQAQAEARAAGSRTIEAEHLLLALAVEPSPTAAAMAQTGHDHDALVDALAREEAAALDAVGVSAAAYGAPPAVVAERRLRLASSAKRTLQETLRLAAGGGAGRLEAAHILLALLAQRRGTAARTLDLVEGDRLALIDRTHALCRAR